MWNDCTAEKLDKSRGVGGNFYLSQFLAEYRLYLAYFKNVRKVADSA